MSLLSIDELTALVEQSQAVSVSIYMPTYRLGPEIQQHPIRFKNLIKEAEAQLQAYGLRSTEARSLLEPALALDDDEFWQHQEEGLAVFIAKGFLRVYRLPTRFEALVVVGDRFHLKPLLPFLTGDGTFYVLTLNQEHARLLKGSRYRVQEIEVEGMPANLESALLNEETSKTGQFRVSTSRGGTRNPFPQPGSFHGEGSPDRDNPKTDILQYFYQVDQAVEQYLHDRHEPLVLAGVEYLLPIYQEANTYPYLIDAGITGNPQLLKPEELHDQAWAIVEPYFLQSQQNAVDYYRTLAGTGQTSTDIREVVPAATYGRVEQLFVAVGVQQWGRFDPTTTEMHLHPTEETGDEDLLDTAAIQTLLHGGTVYAVEPERVPETAPLAAVFRY
ncbi:MAG: hypothetical protein VKJ46_16530 [Leptolyngbyaceae bacterium]|nr:hypothetical protein [Leptolyngbyaceae bacterium]